MTHIKLENVDLQYPLFGREVSKGKQVQDNTIGGKVITEGKQKGVLALENISMHLKEGDQLGILGYNGSGKSTLLKVLAGIYQPTRGHVETNGRIIGMFNLGVGVDIDATGYQNIYLKGLINRLRKKEIDALVPEIEAFSELGDFLHMPMKTYSSGMKMRLLFSIATAMKPDILLLDEWISTGDAAFRAKVDKKLNEVIEQTPIVVIASHNVQRLKNWCNCSIDLGKGEKTITASK